MYTPLRCSYRRDLLATIRAHLEMLEDNVPLRTLKAMFELRTYQFSAQMVHVFTVRLHARVHTRETRRSLVVLDGPSAANCITSTRAGSQGRLDDSWSALVDTVRGKLASQLGQHRLESPKDMKL